MEIKNYRSTLDSNSKELSIQNSDYSVSDTGANGSKYSAYGASESGLGRLVNGDNIYMNGVYMKSFRFTTYSKGVKTYDKRAVFALAGNPKDDEWTKGIFGVLDNHRRELLNCDLKEAENIIISFVKALEISDSDKCIAVLYMNEKGIVACTAGGAKIFQMKKRKLVPVPSRNDGGTEICRLAAKSANESFVLCSSGLMQTVEEEGLTATIGGCSSYIEAVKTVVEHAKSLTRDSDASMIMVGAERKKKPFFIRKTVITAIAVVIVLIAIASVWRFVPALSFKTDEEIGAYVDPKTETEIAEECEKCIIDIERQLEEKESELAEYAKNTYSYLQYYPKYKSVHQAYVDCLDSAEKQVEKLKSELSDIRQTENVYELRAAVKKLEDNEIGELDIKFSELAEAKAAADMADLERTMGNKKEQN